MNTMNSYRFVSKRGQVFYLHDSGKRHCWGINTTWLYRLLYEGGTNAIEVHLDWCCQGGGQCTQYVNLSLGRKHIEEIGQLYAYVSTLLKAIVPLTSPQCNIHKSTTRGPLLSNEEVTEAHKQLNHFKGKLNATTVAFKI